MDGRTFEARFLRDYVRDLRAQIPPDRIDFFVEGQLSLCSSVGFLHWLYRNRGIAKITDTNHFLSVVNTLSKCLAHLSEAAGVRVKAPRRDGKQHDWGEAFIRRDLRVPTQ